MNAPIHTHLLLLDLPSKPASRRLDIFTCHWLKGKPAQLCHKRALKKRPIECGLRAGGGAANEAADGGQVRGNGVKPQAQTRRRASSYSRRSWAM